MAARKKKSSKVSGSIVEIANNTKRLITINIKPENIVQRIKLPPGLTEVEKDLWDSVKGDKWVQALLDEKQISLSASDKKVAREITEEASREDEPVMAEQ